MKIKHFPLVIVLCLMALRPAYGAVPKNPTGADWLLMTPEEKVQCVESSVSFLKKKGIPVGQPASYYGAMLNSVVDEPGAEKASITNIVTTLIYKNEPQTRAIIDSLRVKPGAQKGMAAPMTSSGKTAGHRQQIA